MYEKVLNITFSPVTFGLFAWNEYKPSYTFVRFIGYTLVKSQSVSPTTLSIKPHPTPCYCSQMIFAASHLAREPLHLCQLLISFSTLLISVTCISSIVNMGHLHCLNEVLPSITIKMLLLVVLICASRNIKAQLGPWKEEVTSLQEGMEEKVLRTQAGCAQFWENLNSFSKKHFGY